MSAGIPVFFPTAVAIAIHAAITSDVHGITAAGAAITTAATASAQRTAMGVAYGSSGTTVCVGNDSRLSDARTPVAHNQAWSTITATPTTISGYGLTDAASTGANTFTGAQLIRAAATQDAIEILGRAGGTSSFKATITPLALSASRTFSLPDESGTIALRGANTFTGTQKMEITGSSGTVHQYNRTTDSIELDISFLTNDSRRWIWRFSGAETGANAGSVLELIRRSDSDVNLGPVISFYRDTGLVRLPKDVNVVEDLIVGTDPGGSQRLRVGGTARFSGKITTVSAVPASFADLAAVRTWLAAQFA
jgi:hypothetical protein